LYERMSGKGGSASGAPHKDFTSQNCRRD
jgi:hypothetical protein